MKLEFYAEIDPSASKKNHTPRDIELVLQKKDLNEEFWPRLLKDKAKVHFLKTNFDKVCIGRFWDLCLFERADWKFSGSTRTSKMWWQTMMTTCPAWAA